MKKIFIVISLIVVILAPILSEAVPVTIVNSNFETNVLGDGSWQTTSITGWTAAGPYWWSAGTYNPTNDKFNAPLPDGNNIAFANVGGMLTQTLDYYLSANSQLTLSADIGLRLDGSFSEPPQYQLQLWAGQNLLSTRSGTELISGSFFTSVLIYDVLSTNPFLGQQLTIVLSNIGGSQVNFDNITLNDDQRAVPEPSTLLLLGSGLLGVGFFARKRRK